MNLNIIPANNRLRIVGLLAFMLIMGGFLVSGGKPETEQPPAKQAPALQAPALQAAALQTVLPIEKSWTVTVPASASPGDCIVVVIDSGSVLADAGVTFRGGAGEIIARAVPFDVSVEQLTENTVLFRQVALVPLPSTLESGPYSLEAAALQHGLAVSLAVPLTVEKRDFFSEEIALNPSNTAIKTDTSPLRLLQIKALNDILSTRNPDAPRFSGPYISPSGAVRRTSQFGDRRVYRYSTGKKDTAIHWGIDFGVPTGTPVFAAGDGKVVMAEKRISTGWTVVIEHLPGVYSLYYHLDALLTTVGEDVRAGTLIARSGNTGLSTGAHLHWEFRVNGEAVSPDWFAGRILY